jgi:hypothetical protein
MPSAAAATDAAAMRSRYQPAQHEQVKGAGGQLTGGVPLESTEAYSGKRIRPFACAIPEDLSSSDVVAAA